MLFLDFSVTKSLVIVLRGARGITRMNIDNIYSLISDMCNFTSVILIALAVGSIVVFARMFKHDFEQKD